MDIDSNVSRFLIALDLEPNRDNLDIINSILNSSQSFYRNFHIPKRSGGKRTIDSPYPTLRHLQELIYTRFGERLEVHKNSFAFVPGKSFIDHAKFHLGCSELLTLDIENFFPNISRQKVYEVFEQSGVSAIFTNYISYICTNNNYLPQGACTSPIISNASFYSSDVILEKLANKLNLKYSRYADDLAFSGTFIPRNLTSMVNRVLNHQGFNLNSKKTKLKIKGAKKIITGVSITTGQLKVPKSFKRELRASIYELEKYSKELYKMSNFDPLIYEKTLGKLNYVLQVEPENQYAINKRSSLLLSYKELQKTGTILNF
jgi:RNA-directed DNA polymerase